MVREVSCRRVYFRRLEAAPNLADKGRQEAFGFSGFWPPMSEPCFRGCEPGGTRFEQFRRRLYDQYSGAVKNASTDHFVLSVWHQPVTLITKCRHKLVPIVFDHCRKRSCRFVHTIGQFTCFNMKAAPLNMIRTRCRIASFDTGQRSAGFCK